jgi:hypothetical protein
MAFSAMKSGLELWGTPLSTIAMERLSKVRYEVGKSRHKIKIYDFDDHIALQGGPSNSGNGVRIDKSSIESSDTELLNAFHRLEFQLDSDATARR